MSTTFGRALGQWIFTAAIGLVIAGPAFSQQPTDEQRNAIRSACRADYEANCASVPPGGAASLQCLQKNMSKLSASCQRAVVAVEPAAAPKAEVAPAAAPPASAPANASASAAPKAAASAPATQPTDAQVAAMRSACRSDYQRNCASVPTGGPAALSCLEKNRSKLSAGCQKAVSAVGGGAAAAGTATSSPAAAMPAAAPALVLRPVRPREELFVVRSACGRDVRALCAGIAPGGGRIVQCLAVKSASLSPACRDVLAQFAAQ
ncbi:cysteine rich repeat-containing protein [Nitrobacter sp. JJSN]|uniref:cysteine rich repeat-containing protein n=1 Tax=Nitrobacter sp. JJSN TaxID=3453033 RepID=UPI003F75A0A4